MSDLAKIAAPLLIGALRTAGSLISRYAVRRAAAPSFTQVASAGKTAFNAAGRVGRSNALGAVGLGTTLYGAYDIQRTTEENEAYRNELAQRRRELATEGGGRWWQRRRQQPQGSAAQALSDAEKDADNDGVPGERELPEDQRNFRRGNARTT
jgi:hypothetical protein